MKDERENKLKLREGPWEEGHPMPGSLAKETDWGIQGQCAKYVFHPQLSTSPSLWSLLISPSLPLSSDPWRNFCPAMIKCSSLITHTVMVTCQDLLPHPQSSLDTWTLLLVTVSWMLQIPSTSSLLSFSSL